MRELVLDASIVTKWFYTENEAEVEAATRLKDEYDRGELVVAAPPLLPLELLNAAARRRRASSETLARLARDLVALRFTVQQPSLERVAHWAGQGLTAYDACYVALAEERRTVVVTADQEILAIAGRLARTLAEAASD